MTQDISVLGTCILPSQRTLTMSTLTEIKRLLACIGLSNAKSIQINGFNVPRVYIRYFTVGSLFTAVIGEILVYVSSHGGIESILIHLYIVICIVYILLIYLCLLWKTEQIGELFSYLENVVNEREYTK